MSEMTSALDLGEYCRRVEDYLTRANAGHLVRIVGPGFELVRQWAESGVPLSIVFRGIDLKAERHREGASKRPLRIEFCANDVDAIFDQWRKAVGVGLIARDSVEAEIDHDSSEPASKPKSLGKHIERAMDRLSRAAARMDMPEGLRAECSRLLDVLAALKESSARARSAIRDAAIERLEDADAQLATAVRTFAPADAAESAREEAAADLAPFKSRLPQGAWDRSIEITIDRLLRNRLGLPTLQL